MGIRSARARPAPRPWRLMRTECHAAFPGVPRKRIHPSARKINLSAAGHTELGDAEVWSVPLECRLVFGRMCGARSGGGLPVFRDAKCAGETRKRFGGNPRRLRNNRAHERSEVPARYNVERTLFKPGKASFFDNWLQTGTTCKHVNKRACVVKRRALD